MFWYTLSGRIEWEYRREGLSMVLWHSWMAFCNFSSSFMSISTLRVDVCKIFFLFIACLTLHFARTLHFVRSILLVKFPSLYAIPSFKYISIIVTYYFILFLIDNLSKFIGLVVVWISILWYLELTGKWVYTLSPFMFFWNFQEVIRFPNYTVTIFMQTGDDLLISNS